MAERKISKFNKAKNEEKAGRVETQTSSEATLGDLDPEKVAAYLQSLEEAADERLINRNRPNEERLEELGLVGHENGALRPRIAALLLFGYNPQKFLPHSSVKLARFKGRDVDGSIVDRQELFGSLDQIIEHAVGFAGRNMRVASQIKGVYRQDVPEYPIVAIREAVTNALAHRDYAITGQKVVLRMFDDRLEVESPGALAGPVTIENLGQKRYSRNPLLARLMYELRLIEEMGTGIRRMRKELANLGSDPPLFQNDATSFTAILPALVLPPETGEVTNSAAPTSATISNTNISAMAEAPLFELDENNRAEYFALLKSGLNERQARGLLYGQQRGRLTNKDYRAVNPDITDETARLDLLNLVDKGYLMRIGDKKGASYLPR